MNPFVADLRDWPILRMRSPTSDVHIESFFSIIDDALSREAVFVSIHDTRGMPNLNAVQRRKFADYIQRREEPLGRWIAAHAVIVGSAIERGIVTAVLWLKPAPFPVKVFSTPQEAETWAIAKLRAAQ
ncbi:MAG TPA: hypothetical protein VK034_12160 [Enhygromyxa sp.]|nr:hypothetical protein [Enhygromyxa sp.]